MSKADDDFLEEAKDNFKLAEEAETDNRKEALDDLKFGRLGDQWPDWIKLQRQTEGRPCLTFPRLSAMIRQVTNDARQNRPSIKVHPADSDADPHTADVYNGLIRNIEVTSKADVAYDTALDFAASMGFGYLRINTEYACEDTFDLDIAIKRIANPFSVYGDPNSTEADSSDWDTAFIIDMMPKKRFEAKYKDAETVNWEVGAYAGLKSPWLDKEQVLVAEYFKREEVPKTVLLLSDQSVLDEETYKKQKDDLDKAGVTVEGTRKTRGHKVTQYIMTGAEILEENEWVGKYIPIVPVYGDEVNVEGKRHFRSLIRDAKDAQVMFNVWRTASTELVGLAPKAPFIGKKGAFNSDKNRWAQANTKSFPYLEYDGDTPPERQPFAGIPAGAIQEALNASDDMKAILGIYDASLGAKSNETSGRAILARQREGDVSTFNFVDNLSRAIEHAGRVIIDLIPKVYTGERIIRTLGEQGDVKTVPLNTPVQVTPPQGQGDPFMHTFDLGRGKYDLTVEAGPSFTTRREESANQMLELVRAFPQAAPFIGPLLAKNLDWPGADELAQVLLQVQQHVMGGGVPQGGDPQAAAQAQEQTQKLVAMVQQLQQQLQAAEADKSLQSRELDIKAYEAQTKRAAEVNKANEQRMRMIAGGVPGHTEQ
jgi:hypothetical protein